MLQRNEHHMVSNLLFYFLSFSNSMVKGSAQFISIIKECKTVFIYLKGFNFDAKLTDGLVREPFTALILILVKLQVCLNKVVVQKNGDAYLYPHFSGCIFC